MTPAVGSIVGTLLQTVLIPFAVATCICVGVVLHWKRQGITGRKLTARKNLLFLAVMAVTGLLVVFMLGRAFGG